MTYNQRIAKAYLLQYTQALHELSYLKDRLDEQRAKAEGIKSTLDIPRGLKGNKEYPLEGQGTHDPTARQRLLDILVEQSKEYDKRAKEVEQQAKEIEQVIEELGNVTFQLILKYHYIKRYDFDSIAKRISYSYYHTIRLHGLALIEIGELLNRKEQMTKDDNQCHMGTC